jgi:predicted DNA-binding transcriptional regulator YafY
MPAKITKIQRWLDLIAYLAGRRYPVQVSELMRLPAYACQTADTARRTFERDKKDLREAGLPLATVPAPSGDSEAGEGYRLSSGDFLLPYLRLVKGNPQTLPGRTRPGVLEVTEEEASAALEALQRVARLPATPLAHEARRAHAKLALDLDPESFPGAPVVYADPPGGAESAAVLRTLTRALTERRWVTFHYRGMRDVAPTPRRVAPYGLLRTGGHWYLVGFDHQRQGMREFRVSRAAQVEAGPTPNDFVVPEDFRLEDWQGREAWEIGDLPPLEARVRLAFPLSLWAERNQKGSLVEAGKDGGAVRAFALRDVGSFLRWVLSWAGAAEILSPPELRAESAAMARATADLYPRTAGA